MTILDISMKKNYQEVVDFLELGWIFFMRTTPKR